MTKPALLASPFLLFIMSSACHQEQTTQVPEVAEADSSESRTKQCNRLINVINEEQDAIKTSGSAHEDMETLGRTLDRVSSTVTAVDVSDTTLQSFRSDYAQMATDLSKALYETAAAIKARDLALIKAATENMDSFDKRESRLVDGINKYCRDK